MRNSWLTKGTENTFLDAASWETVKKDGDAAVKAWIDRELLETTVTVVLIGKHTASRKWVRYEIQESQKRGNGMLGVYIHGIKNQNQESNWFRGDNPFDALVVKGTDSFFGLWDYETETKLSEMYPSYYWHDDNGRENLPSWVEEAAAKASK